MYSDSSDGIYSFISPFEVPLSLQVFPNVRFILGKVTDDAIALSDTHVFLLNEYFIELNTANFKFLNKLLN